MGEKKEVKIRFSTVICIILIVLLLAGCGALYYFGFIQKDKKLEKVEAEKTQLETKNAELEKQIIVVEKEVEEKNTEEKENSKKTSEVPITDLVAISCNANNENAELFFSYIKDGKVYYFHEADYEGKETGQYYKFSVSLKSQYNYEEKMKQYEGINNAKRIKMYNSGTGILPTVYVITEDGKVYTGSFSEHDFALHLDNRLKEYEVEDILSKTGEMKDEFKLLLKDGTTKIVTVEL